MIGGGGGGGGGGIIVIWAVFNFWMPFVNTVSVAQLEQLLINNTASLILVIHLSSVKLDFVCSQ